MAWLEKRAGRFRIKFRFGGQNFQHTLKETTEREANAVLGRLEDNLMLLERGRLEIPPDADVALFLVSDGRLNQKPTLQKVLRLKEYFTQYQGREIETKERNDPRGPARCAFDVNQAEVFA